MWAQTGGTATPAASQSAIPDYTIMTIQGKPISGGMFNSILYNVSGPRVFDEVFNLTVVQQMCINSGIPMDNKSYGDRVQAEIDRTLMSLTIPETSTTSTKPTTAAATAVAATTGASKMSEEERNTRSGVLGQLLAQRNMTWIEWRMNVETAANLRELVKDKIAKTTKEEANTAWLAEYGERRNVHIIALPGTKTEAAALAAKLRPMLTAEKDKKTPEQAIQEAGAGQTQGWRISKNATEVPEIKAAAYELKKAGDVSSIVEVKQGDQTQSVLVELDSIEEDRTAKNPFDAKTQADFEAKVFDAKQANLMQNQLIILRANALDTVDIKEPVLKAWFDGAKRQMQEQREKAAANMANAASAPSGAQPTSATAPGALPPIPK